MRVKKHAAYRFATILICQILIGCGSGDDLARVKGRVTLNGEPLEGASVEFQPTADGDAPSAGETDAKGRYELMFSFGTPGVLPGEHIVSITTAGTYFDDEGNELERQERVPDKYNANSELKRIVEPRKNTIDFEL